MLERNKPVTKSGTAPVTTAPTPGVPAGVQPTPGAPATGTPGTPAAGQPSVTLDYGNGNVKTVPLDVNKLPKVDPNSGPPSPAPAKK